MGLQRQREAVPGLSSCTRRKAPRASAFDVTIAGWIAGLRRPVRLHQRPARRRQHPRREQQQPRVLQHPDAQQGDGVAEHADGPARYKAYGSPRHPDHDELRPVGLVRQPERARLRLGARPAAISSSPPTQRRPQHALHQVGSGSEARRITNGAPAEMAGAPSPPDRNWIQFPCSSASLTPVT